MLDSADDDTKVGPLMGCDHMTDFTASTVVAKSKFAYFKQNSAALPRGITIFLKDETITILHPQT